VKVFWYILKTDDILDRYLMEGRFLHQDKFSDDPLETTLQSGKKQLQWTSSCCHQIFICLETGG
jgi:hypothetical protein